MEKIFLIKIVSFYAAVISLLGSIVFLILNYVASERVKVNLNKSTKKEVLKLDDEDWTKSFTDLDSLSTSKSDSEKELKKQDEIKSKNDKKTDKKIDKFELKDL